MVEKLNTVPLCVHLNYGNTNFYVCMYGISFLEWIHLNILGFSYTLSYPGHHISRLYVLKHERSWVYCIGVSMQTVIQPQSCNSTLYWCDRIWNMLALFGLHTQLKILEHWKVFKSSHAGWQHIIGPVIIRSSCP